MAFITISGQDFNPSACSFTFQDLDTDNSGRSLDGLMTRDRICTKIQLALEWNHISVNEMSRLLTALEDVFFTVRYWNPKLGRFAEDTFYCGDRTVPVYSYVNNQIVYDAGFKVNLIQR
jgi:hypothetical protein